MLRVRAAFDPTGLCNPGKIIPMLRGCGEGRAVAQPLTTDGGNGSRAIAAERLVSSHVNEGVEPATGGTIAAFADHVSSEHVEIFAPESIAEVCEVMRLASSRGWSIIPTARPPEQIKPRDRAQVMISTCKLNQIVEHEPADLIAVAQAGVTIGAFNQELFQGGQWLPLDPPDDGSATLGGVLATGRGGPQELGYGGPRRHIIGMKVVLADGHLIKAGGRVVKNVAGYDLCKLFTGSYGTLGVIVEVNFKLRPLPFETCTIVVSGARTDLLETATNVITSRLFPTAVELVSPMLGLEDTLAQASDNHQLFMRFAGSPNAVQEQTKAVMRMAGSRGSKVSDDAALWQTLSALPYKFNDGLICRARVKPSDLSAFLAQLDDIAPDEHSVGRIWQAGVGDGRVRFFNRPRTLQDQTIEQSILSFNKLRTLARAMKGSLILESAPAVLQDRVDAWGDWGNYTGLMRRIKQELDPMDILSPGRFGNY